MLSLIAALLVSTASSTQASADDIEGCHNSTGSWAVDFCTRVIERNPKDADAYRRRGRGYWEKRDYEHAIADFDQAIKLNPKFIEAYDDRSITYERKGDWDHAIDDRGQIINLDPRPHRYSSRSATYARRGDYDLALADIVMAINLDPKNAFFYRLRAEINEFRGDLERAIADYGRIINLDPKNAYSYVGRGVAYEQFVGDFDHAIADYNVAIGINPKPSPNVFPKRLPSIDWFRQRGNAYERKGDHDHAISDYNQAIKLDTQDPDSYNDRGFAFEQRGDHARAITDYDRAIKIYDQMITQHPNESVLHHLRGLAYQRKNEHDRALADYDRAITLDPKNAFAYANRGDTYETAGDHQHAIADYDQALKLKPLAQARDGRERAMTRLAARPAPAQPVAAVPQPATLPQAAPPPPQLPPYAILERRVALVIGMSAYTNVAQLHNPAHDARAIADTFRRLGFAEVIEQEDLTRAEMEQVLKDFGDKAADADWAVIYYAGHGVEMNGANYLVPVDAKLARADHVEDETVTLTRVLSKAELARKLRMVILDACRNNPFRMASAEGRPRAIGRGLSPVEPIGGVLVCLCGAWRHNRRRR
jgi:tetratricopeptide (TPR) repeat protein